MKSKKILLSLVCVGLNSVVIGMDKSRYTQVRTGSSSFYYKNVDQSSIYTIVNTINSLQVNINKKADYSGECSPTSIVSLGILSTKDRQEARRVYLQKVARERHLKNS